MKKRVKKKTFRYYATWLKDGICAATDIADTNHNAHFKYLFPWRHLSFEREFNNLIITIKLPRRQIKDIRVQPLTATQVFWVSLSKSLKKFSERVHFWQCCVLSKKGTPQGFLKGFASRFSWQNYRMAILKKAFSIRTLSVAAFVYANNFLRNKRSKHQKYKQRVLRVAYQESSQHMQFFVKW